MRFIITVGDAVFGARLDDRLENVVELVQRNLILLRASRDVLRLCLRDCILNLALLLL